MATHEVALQRARTLPVRLHLEQRRLDLLIVPYIVILFVVFGIPFAYILAYSLGLGRDLGVQHYARLINQATYWRVFGNTAYISGLVTLLCALIGYPLALFLVGMNERNRRLVLPLVLVPFWTSILVRSYAWLVILQQQGILNRTLVEIGVIDQPLTLVHNLVGVLAGMTYVLLPFMVLSLYVSMRGVDRTLAIAARSLGAGHLAVFWKVMVPLSRPGLMAGSSLVFILAFGFFITPALLGGLSETMAGMVIDAQMNRILDWNFGAALAVTLTAIVVVTTLTVGRILDVNVFLRRSEV